MDWERIGTVAVSGELSIRRVGFGGAWLTGPGTYGAPPSLDTARDVVRRAVGAGIQLIDTADCYGPEISETLICEALYPYPADVVVSTKGGRLPLGNNRWRANGRAEHLKKACEGSLRRLRRETIDLYQLNAVDPTVPIEESIGALVELRDEGKIRNIGICNVDVGELNRARAVVRISSVQDRYDLLTRANDAVLDECTRAGILFLPWFPPQNDLEAEPDSLLDLIAGKYDVRPAQICLAWLFARSPVMVPLPGTVNPDWFAEDLAALEISLTADEIRELDLLSLGSPPASLSRQPDRPSP